VKTAWPDKVIRWVGSVPSLIAHTLVFAAALLAIAGGFEAATVMLVLTTAVSLEAIYLSILIQMALNRQAAAIAAVEEDVHEIQEDVEDIGEDVGEIQEDVEEIQKDVDEIQEDVDEIQDEIVDDAAAPSAPAAPLDEIEADIARLAARVAALRKGL
jgi:septal ring factor EnvC (AmiA/AmiB activator)